MATAPQPRYVVPNPRLPRVVGILNIVFGALLILVGLGRAVHALYMPAMAEMMRAQQSKLEADARAQEEAAKAALLGELDRRAAAAKTPAEEAAIEAERAAIRSRPRPFVPNLTSGMEMARDPAYVRFDWAEILTGLALNVPLVAAGIALLRPREWGRRLALWVAGLKLVRLAILAVASVVVVVPLVARSMDRQFEAIGAQMPTGRAATPAQARQLKQMSGVMGVVMTGFYVGFYVLGAIYPAVVLGVLTRPGVRAACQEPKPEPGPDPWR
jgi:hypothetical protein